MPTASHAATPTVTRYVGKCPVCEGDFKLTTDAMPSIARFEAGQKMVHHGYERPGHGSIVGDCYAVGYPAYEESCEVTREYRGIIVAQRDNVEAYLGRLRGGEVTEITEPSWRRGEKLTVHRDGDVMWPRELANEISRYESRARVLDDEIERLTALVDGWSAKPLRTIEEFEAPIKAERDAAKAKRTADRDAKTAAKIESYRKRLATAVRKRTMSTIADIFESAPRQLGDRGLTREQAYAAIGGDAVFAAFGLDPTQPCGFRTPNGDIASAMRSGGRWVPEARCCVPVEWPAALA